VKGADFETEAVLKDGTPVFIRLLHPEDRGVLQEGFNRLSPRSRYSRFMMPLGRLSGNQLAYLTEIDNENHLALCAGLAHRDPVVGLGVARYVRLENDPDSAEFAVTVIDEYQNRGLGKLLLELLISAAREKGVKRLIGYVLHDNEPMLSLLSHFECGISRDDYRTLKVELSTLP
jgi:GNAT superfamily N-acetyltransferase